MVLPVARDKLFQILELRAVSVPARCDDAAVGLFDGFRFGVSVGHGQGASCDVEALSDSSAPLRPFG